METYTIATPGPLVVREFSDVDAVKHYVEDMAPLKRGWTGEWSEHPTRKAWVYRRRNSRGRLLKRFDILVREGAPEWARQRLM